MTLTKSLLHEQEPTRRSPILGLVLVTSAALLFGVVAACIKAIMLPTLVLQLCRSVIEWVLGVAAAFAYFRGQIDKIPEPRIVPEVEVVQHGFDPAVTPMTKKTRTVPPGSTGPPTSMTLLLIGPAELRGWLVLGALLYWLFLAGWWFALSAMPIGDATTIVYVGPIFTATFAYLFLGERIDWTFYPIVLLDGAGLLCITQPTFIFGGTGAAGDAADASSGYFLGALSAFLSAVVAGLLPVCTRKSKACFWTAVNHVSSLLSTLVFTPLAITIWFFVDPNANAAVAESLHELVPPAVGGGSFEPAKWALLISATVIGFAGLAMQTMGYQLEEAARASVMTVLEIPFAYLLQFVIFKDEVNALGLLGVGLVISGTMLNLLRRMQMAAEASLQVSP